jgi:hypothetical protein
VRGYNAYDAATVLDRTGISYTLAGYTFTADDLHSGVSLRDWQVCSEDRVPGFITLHVKKHGC